MPELSHKVRVKVWLSRRLHKYIDQAHMLVYCGECDADVTVFHYQHVGREVLTPYDRTWLIIRDYEATAQVGSIGVNLPYYRDPLITRLSAIAVYTARRLVSSVKSA